MRLLLSQSMELDPLEPQAGPAATSPWLVPFFVVPSVIALSAALIFLLFGWLTASEKTPRENLDRVLHGGRNDRKQGAFQLQVQLQDFRERRIALDPRFVTDVLGAFDHARRQEDVLLRCYLVSVLGYLGDPRAVPALVEALDDEGEVQDSNVTWSVRFLAAKALAGMGVPEAAPPLLGILQGSQDKGLRIVAAGGLGGIGTPACQEALRAALEDPEREVRWTAALGLARLGDPAGAPRLREMLDPGNAAAWKQEGARFEAMDSAIQALLALKDRESIPLLRRLEAEEKNPKIRDLAMKGVRGLETP